MKTGGTPNDLLPALNQVSCIIMGPLIQMVLYPYLHRRHIYVGPITRIAIGFGFVALSMLYAALVQHMIYSSPPCYNRPSDCSHSAVERSGPTVWIQAPVYFLISTGEIFSYVTGLEYAYKHSPKGMEIIVQAFNLFVAGIGSALALAISIVAHDPNMVFFYAALTLGMSIAAVVFWCVFRQYNKSHARVAHGEPILNGCADIQKGRDGQEDTGTEAKRLKSKRLSAGEALSIQTPRAEGRSTHG
jgi:POT family proton-dependent oligopeptide transporter